MRRNSATRARANTAMAGASTTSATSAPGHCAPAPSLPQNVPNAVSITPTMNFMVFSGTRASGARTANPAAVTRTTAQPAAAAASGRLCSLLPKVRAMNTTSSPSNSTPLNDKVNAYQSATSPLPCGGAVRAAASSDAKIAVSSCGSLCPAARRTALRSHWSPKISNRPPTTSRSAPSGTRASAGPRTATSAAKAISAAQTPRPAERQLRAVPAASTIVSASTASTRQPRNTARNNAAPVTGTPFVLLPA
ncbi:hypothetical protein [Amycolatopsis sp.]|uniref:hypothetical protein n=1 Tax=Amycolatopsis sp. TaxID=37632 RepID=UPI0039C85825